MSNKEISGKMQLPPGTTISSSAKHSKPHGKAKELRLFVTFSDVEKKEVSNCYLEIKVGNDGEVNFTFQVTD